ncbi:MAG: hypothetical protein JW841_00345 [Deltaproteobacteria bacterium]|nr:hypothetical protein [Deltaproteobacteria bacterium]
MRKLSIILLLASLSFNTSCGDDTTKTAEPPPNAPQLMPTPLDLTLWINNTTVNSHKTSNIVILNGGKTALQINSVTLAGYKGLGNAETTFTIDTGTLPASVEYNTTIALPVTFSPTSVGVHLAEVNITSNAENRPNVTFYVIGIATDTNIPSTAKLYFYPEDGVVTTTSTGSHRAPVRFINLGAQELLVYGYKITGTDASSFTIPTNVTQPSTECSTVACGDSLTSIPAGCNPIRVAFGSSVPLVVEYSGDINTAAVASFEVVSNSSSCNEDALTLTNKLAAVSQGD